MKGNRYVKWFYWYLVFWMFGSWIGKLFIVIVMLVGYLFWWMWVFDLVFEWVWSKIWVEYVWCSVVVLLLCYVDLKRWFGWNCD